ncbi:MAG: hypothetical protein ACN4GW_09100 [Desulforhopalus sp.]
MKNKDELLAQAETLVNIGEKVLATESNESQLKPLVNEKKFHDFRISALSFLSRVFGENSNFHESFRTEVTHPTSSRTRRGLGLLQGAQRELQGDWLSTTEGAIARNILEEMLKLGENHLELGNSSAAACITGAVVELHLRYLFQAKGVSIHNQIQGKAVAKKVAQLAGDGYKKKILSRQENKAVISWIELSTDGAEGKNPVTAKQVKTMIRQVKGFLATTRY